MKRKKFLQTLAGVVAAVVMATSIAPTGLAKANDTAVHGNGISDISDKWFFEDGGWNNNYAPNAIDPTLFYGADNKLYMVYGSWSGGLFILEIDKETGEVIYPGDDSIDEVSGNFTDRYFGTHIAGANHQSGEGPFIDYDEKTGYYWLYETYGGLTATGGYNMRLFRSENVYGPYVDAAGNNAAGSGVDNDKYGVKLIGNYRFLNQPGYRAAGHNSALIDDDGSRYLVFHQRFDEPGKQTERHEVRVHQQFLNADKWPVTAVYENRGEKIGHYADDKVVGSYEIINHGTDSKGNMIQSQIITLNADGTITGELEGTWKKTAGRDYDYVTLKIGSDTYKGVFFEQQDETAEKKKVMTFTAIGDNNASLWGSALTVTDEVKTQLAAAVLDLQMPSDANDDITLITESKEATISWASDKTNVVTNEGKVTRPDEDTVVILTATIQSNDATLTKEYKVKIAGKAKLICGYNFEKATVSGDAISAVEGSLNASPAALKGTAEIATDPVRGQVLQIVSPKEVYNENYLALPEDTLANVKTKGYTVAMWVNCGAGIWEHSALFNAMRDGTYPMTRIGVNLCGRINANGFIDGGYYNTVLRGTGWHHVAYSIDATGLKTWVDGELFQQIDKDLTSCFDESNNWSIQKASDVRVGSGSPWTDRDIENAMFDDVEVYDSALVRSEIEALYAKTKVDAPAQSEQPTDTPAESETEQQPTEIPVETETEQQPAETPAESQPGQTTEETVEASAQELVTETAVVAASNGEQSTTLKTPDRVSVHDPSIVKSNDGTYYVFGSHLANAKSTDLINWTQMTGDYGSYDWKTKSIYGDIINNLSESFAWAGYDDGDCAGGNLAVWAPDVIWNADYKWENGTKGAWMIYYSASSTWRRSCIGYAVSKNIEGPYKYVDTVIYSGFTKTGATDGNSTRNTMWDNDYLNLKELIEEYKKVPSTDQPIINPPVVDQPTGGSSSSSDSQSTTDVKKPETPEKTEEVAAEVGTEVKVEEGKFEVVESKTDEPAVAFTAPASTKEKKVEIPDVVTVDGTEYKVTKIADGAYKKNTKITTVTIGENVTVIGKNAFSGCTNLKTVKINANVEKIGNGAFNGCKKMEKVSIPKNVQEIGAKAFNGCKNLKMITIKSTALKKVDATAFKGIKANATIKVPKKQYKAYKKMLKKVLPSTVKIVKY